MCTISGGDVWCLGKKFFGEFASRLAAQSHSSKTIMLNNIYGRLILTLVRANARAFNTRVATTMDLLEG